MRVDVGSATGAWVAAAAAAATAGRTCRGPAMRGDSRRRCGARALRGAFERPRAGMARQTRPANVMVSGSDAGARRYHAFGWPR
ncbi:hypothetical protein ITP53_50165 [Nonomuraea sp. K274]|uniref:Uncharacterized protein n=1 Tax=Nonomuraea cypriaca TaxID=1187855 RepID=A0A931F390_9ACTN|nr:hypothetical protein [Nonomuraea cypriaca]MBF8193714.1 hypothetical protein [Nonomuraea cypriaca]